MNLRLLFCVLFIPISMLSGNESFLYTSFARMEVFPDLLNEKKIRVVGVLAYSEIDGAETFYLYSSLGKFERRVAGEGVRLYLAEDAERKSTRPLEELNGRFVEVWGEYLGPDGIEDQSFTGGYLGVIRNVIRICLAEG